MQTNYDKGLSAILPNFPREQLEVIDQKLLQLGKIQAYQDIIGRGSLNHRGENDNLNWTEGSQPYEKVAIPSELSGANKNFFSQRARSVDVISKKKAIPKILNQNVAAILDKYKLLDKAHSQSEQGEERNLPENLNIMNKPLNSIQNANISFSNPEIAAQFTSILESSQNRNFSTLKTTGSETNHSHLGGTLNTLSNFESSNNRKNLHFNRQHLSERNQCYGDDFLIANERFSMTSRPQLDKENIRFSEGHQQQFNSLKLDKKVAINSSVANTAVSEAMKALQERVRIYEEESTILKRELEDMRNVQQVFAEEQRLKFLNEQGNLNHKIVVLEKKLHDSVNETNLIHDQLNKLQIANSKLESESTVLKMQNQKFKDEISNYSQQTTMLQKEIDILEKEKNRHLEQNANDRDLFETKIDDLSGQLESERKTICSLQNEIKSFVQIKQDLESEIKRLIQEQRDLERKNKENLADLEIKTEKLIKERINHLDEINLLRNQLQELNMLKNSTERDRGTLQKKLSEIERNIQSSANDFEEKLEEN